MTDKTLFIHAGGAKTGSSALQNFFHLNASKLESLGFAYENRLHIEHEHEIGSANGMLLYETVLSPTSTDDEIDNAMSSYFGGCNSAICSSEFFAELDISGWKKLFESSIRLGVKLKVIFYVRNVIPYLLSAYDQIIKRHGGDELFDEWVKKAIWQHGKALRTMANVLPKSIIHVIHFDHVRANLIRGFLDILGVDSSFEIDPKDQKRQVNRSLTNEERNALIAANKILGAAYSKELSELLIYANPNATGEPAEYTKATIDSLLDNFNTEVNWVNSVFFNKKAVVSVLPTKPAKKILHLKFLGKKSKIKPKEKINLEKLLLGWALEKLKTVQDETEQTLMETVKVAEQNSSRKFHPDLPTDFDVLAYLLINRDILHAGVDPIQHYIDYGKNEGRFYKFHKKTNGEPDITNSEVKVSLDKLFSKK
ncbi:MAG: hypothetical protein ACR65R_20685 [Methylomicrobium sp.]